VPQRRKRFVVLALASTVRPMYEPLDEALHEWIGHPSRTVRWAIADLASRVEQTPYDSPSRLSPRNRVRANWLVANDLYDLPNGLRPACHQGPHRYISMYGRLAWDLPAQTITSGFGSMGQGRHVHPLAPRVLTPHEAARIQTFPDHFRFSPRVSRTRLAEMIGNAAPPIFNASVGRELLQLLAQHP
jgi:DNA (cytosine-5)-methyltransferase 1